MISVTAGMIWKSIFASAIIGALFALVSALTKKCVALIKSLIFRKRSRRETRNKSGLLANIVEFLFTFAIGISYLLLLYAFVDGVFEIYTLVVFLAVFFTTEKAIFGIVGRLGRRRI